MPAAIVVKNLSKSYRVGRERVRRRYGTLRESLTTAVAAPLSWLKRRSVYATTEEFWALKDVSFEVQPGEVIGIIGRNGAGKSTLLKILSRIARPTQGRAVLNGRVGSLLEVGTGFHPELTGRENIFMNGSILGMSSREIKGKFDEIVEFSGVVKFLDTPVKRYSSGMQVRLAFAVAAHLEPEIVIVDEVLAVGDLEFQKKCLGKMEDVAHSGRTVLFVSHNMAAVESLCKRGILLENGQLLHDGSVESAVDRFRELLTQRSSSGADVLPASANGAAIDDFAIEDIAGRRIQHLDFLEPFAVRLRVNLAHYLKNIHATITLWRRTDGCRVTSISTQGLSCGPMGGGITQLRCEVNPNPLLPGDYTWSITLKNPHPLLQVDDLARFEVTERVLPGASHPFTRNHGVVCLCPVIQKQ